MQLSSSKSNIMNKDNSDISSFGTTSSFSESDSDRFSFNTVTEENESLCSSDGLDNSVDGVHEENPTPDDLATKWHTLTSLLPLFQLLPGLKQHSNTYVLSGPITHADISTFHTYSKLVKVLSLTGPYPISEPPTPTPVLPTAPQVPESRASLQWLCRMLEQSSTGTHTPKLLAPSSLIRILPLLPNACLLPSLQRLTINEFAWKNMPYSELRYAYPSFLVSTLREIELDGCHKRAGEVLVLMLEMLPCAVPELRRLVLRGTGGFCLPVEILMGVVGMKELRYLELNDIVTVKDLEVLEKVGQLPELRTFVLKDTSLNYSTSEEGDSSEMKKGFKALQNLHITASPNLILNLLQSIECDTLQELKLTPVIDAEYDEKEALRKEQAYVKEEARVKAGEEYAKAEMAYLNAREARDRLRDEKGKGYIGLNEAVGGTTQNHPHGAYSPPAPRVVYSPPAPPVGFYAPHSPPRRVYPPTKLPVRPPSRSPRRRPCTSVSRSPRRGLRPPNAPRTGPCRKSRSRSVSRSESICSPLRGPSISCSVRTPPSPSRTPRRWYVPCSPPSRSRSISPGYRSDYPATALPPPMPPIMPPGGVTAVCSYPVIDGRGRSPFRFGSRISRSRSSSISRSRSPIFISQPTGHMFSCPPPLQHPARPTVSWAKTLEDIMQFIPNRWRALQELTIDLVDMSVRGRVFELPSRYFDSLQLLKNLESLQVENWNIVMDWQEMLRTLVTSFKEMKNLSLPLGKCSSLIDFDTLQTIAECCPVLEKLQVPISIDHATAIMLKDSKIINPLQILSVASTTLSPADMAQKMAVARVIDTIFPRVESIKTHFEQGDMVWKDVWRLVRMCQDVRGHERKQWIDAFLLRDSGARLWFGKISQN
ncbi:hypothetical protein BDQ17DRAFT_1358781 [Cyathus striatus]|nr:hypothetical protein BDQ17DRAFT_1358781 [Cyathus striatus]